MQIFLKSKNCLGTEELTGLKESAMLLFGLFINNEKFKKNAKEVLIRMNEEDKLTHVVQRDELIMLYGSVILEDKGPERLN